MILLFAAFIAMVMLLASSMMKRSEAYGRALNAAQRRPEVVEAIGVPLTPGFWVSGSVQVEGASGTAELSIPVSGPKGQGVIHVEAVKSAGQWHDRRMEVEIEGRNLPIQLLTPSPTELK